MADKQIQLKDNSGNDIFPKTFNVLTDNSSTPSSSSSDPIGSTLQIFYAPITVEQKISVSDLTPISFAEENYTRIGKQTQQKYWAAAVQAPSDENWTVLVKSWIPREITYNPSSGGSYMISNSITLKLRQFNDTLLTSSPVISETTSHNMKDGNRVQPFIELYGIATIPAGETNSFALTVENAAYHNFNGVSFTITLLEKEKI